MTPVTKLKPIFQCKQRYIILLWNTFIDILFVFMILSIASLSIEIGLIILCLWIPLKIISWMIYQPTFTFEEDGIVIKSLSQSIRINWSDITSVEERIGLRRHIVIISPLFPKRQYIVGIWINGFHPVFAIWKLFHTNYSSAQELLSSKVKDKYKVKKRVF